MRNPQSRLSDERAQKELKGFLAVGWTIAIIVAVFGGVAAVMSLAFGGRCIVLSWHKGNATQPGGTLLKIASILLVALSVIELALH